MTRFLRVFVSCSLVGGAALTIAVFAGSAPARTSRRSSSSPSNGVSAVFAAVSDGPDYHFKLELRSTSTGRRVSVLGRLGQSWTNNGFALSPDGRFVFFTLIPSAPRSKSLLLEEVSVAGHRRRLIGHGEEPAVSPNGALVAYASGEGKSATVVVRNLASGQVRSLNLARWLGHPNNTLNASLAWLGDGTGLVIVPGPIVIAAAARAGSPTAAGASHPTSDHSTRLVVVSVPGRGPLSARRISGPAGVQMPEALGPDRADPDALMVGTFARGDAAVVDRLTIGSGRARLRTVLTIARAQVLAFDPTGQRLLYIQGHRPPNLWTATIRGHHLIHRHLLIDNSALESVAW